MLQALPYIEWTKHIDCNGLARHGPQDPGQLCSRLLGRSPADKLSPDMLICSDIYPAFLWGEITHWRSWVPTWILAWKHSGDWYKWGWVNMESGEVDRGTSSELKLHYQVNWTARLWPCICWHPFPQSAPLKPLELQSSSKPLCVLGSVLGYVTSVLCISIWLNRWGYDIYQNVHKYSPSQCGKRCDETVMLLQ